MFKEVVFLFLLTDVIYVLSLPYYNNSMESKKHYCGLVLELSLNNICRGRYNSPNLNKRTCEYLCFFIQFDSFFLWLHFSVFNLIPLNNDNDGFFYNDNSDEGREYHNFFIKPNTQNPLLLMKRRQKGIVDKCCKNACTERDLLQYCA